LNEVGTIGREIREQSNKIEKLENMLQAGHWWIVILASFIHLQAKIIAVFVN